MTTNSMIVGKALYLEFRYNTWTQQILITPEGLTTTNKLVPMTCYRRKISAVSPRKTWRQASSAFTLSSPEGVPAALEKAIEVTPNLLMFTDPLFSQLESQGWKLHKQPLAVEVTREDMDDVRMSKTPYKILGRITRSRRALNFGEELFVS